MGLTMHFGIALLLTGIVPVVSPISNHKKDDKWGWKLGEGVFDIIIASMLFANPIVTAAVLPFVIGFWMIFYGIMISSNSLNQ